MLLGREFDARDNQPDVNTAIVNESFAKFYFKDTNPIGHKLLVPDTESVKHQLGSLAWFVMCMITVCARKWIAAFTWPSTIRLMESRCSTSKCERRTILIL